MYLLSLIYRYIFNLDDPYIMRFAFLLGEIQQPVDIGGQWPTNPSNELPNLHFPHMYRAESEPVPSLPLQSASAVRLSIQCACDAFITYTVL